MKKSPLGLIIVSIMTLACLGYLVGLWFQIFYSPDFVALNHTVTKVFVAIALGINLICLLVLWIPSFRELVLLVLYAFRHKKWFAYFDEMSKKKLTINPKVVVIYCYYNEFDARALRKSIKQNYNNYEFALLDDSTKPEVRAEIDRSVAELQSKGYKISVVRRDNRRGFKGGAINDFLRTHDEYEYFAVADSDEILCYDFITQMLKYFQEDKTLGGVQARHEEVKGKNFFDKCMRLKIRPEMLYSFTARTEYGGMTLHGHGMMISREAFVAVDGFPEIVVEDTGMSMKMLAKGYKIEYAYNVVCEEAFPVNYVAFKKREIRCNQGDIEVAKKGLLKQMMFSKSVPLSVKLDLFTTFRIGKVFSPFGGFFILISTIIMWALGFASVKYGIGILLFGLLSFLVTFIAMIIFNIGKESFWQIVFSVIVLFVCCGSLAPAYVGNMLLCMLGYKPTFTVTPKTESKYTVWEGVKYNWGTIVFVSVMLIATWIICKDPAPALLMFVYAFASIFITVLSNFRTKEQRKLLQNNA